ncbi:hypothetical protein GF336_06015 [Candidatus Woesearchaeota archaeon]|nr:hypothetical protein [Candidatus Woesearchaeota archaeon]
MEAEETREDSIRKEIMALESSLQHYSGGVSDLVEAVSEDKEYISFLDQYAVQEYEGMSAAERVKAMIQDKKGLPAKVYNEPDTAAYQLNI